MSTPPPRRQRRRALYATIGSFALAAAALSSVATTGAASAAPTEDCTPAFPVADLGAGDDVTGLTVTTGTDPEQFTGKVLGVLNDGIAPGLDLVMVKVDPAGLTGIDPTEVKGIWQGMSGSPVYADDGRLIGAVAYGLSYEQSWVAGVTPYEDMDDYLGSGSGSGAGSGSDATAPTKVRLSGRAAARVAAAAGISQAKASQGFTQLPTPLAVSGVASRLLHPSAKEIADHPWLRSGGYAAGRAGAAVDADSIVAGGNLAAGLSYGDITMAGVGTATSVCDGDVVAFGHPMDFAGETSMSLHPADSLYIQGDAPSFKVSNLGDPVGTIFGDHLTGITGSFGATPTTSTVTSDVSYGARSRTGTSYLTAQTPDNLATLTYYETTMNHYRVFDAAAPGSEELTWTVKGTDADDKPFTLSYSDRYLSTWDLADDIGYSTGYSVYQIAGMDGVSVDSVTSSGTPTTDTTQFRIKAIEQRRAGHWVKVSERKPAVANAGSTLSVRARLSNGRYLSFSFHVPRNAKGRTAELAMVGGGSTGLNLGDTPAEAKKALKNAVRSDTVQAQFGKVDLDAYYDDYYYRKGKDEQGRPVKFTQTKVSAKQAGVVRGVSSASVQIR